MTSVTGTRDDPLDPGHAVLAGYREEAAAHRRFRARIDAVRAARRFVTEWLEGEIPNEELLIGDIALAVSEACTNVFVHAYPAGEDGVFDVTVGRSGTTVRLIVGDEGTGMVPRPDSPGLGLGMALMASITDALQVRPGPDGRGTVIVMLFSAQGALKRTFRH